MSMCHDNTYPPPHGHYEPGNNTYTTGSGQILRNLHPATECAGRPCPIHNPTPLPRGWYTSWRVDRKIMEVICPEHGVGHPHPDSPWPSSDPNWLHGCCGCCHIFPSEHLHEGF